MNQLLSNIISSISTSLVKTILFIGLILVLFFYVKSCVNDKNTSKYNSSLAAWNTEKKTILKTTDSLKVIVQKHTDQIDSSNKIIQIKTITISKLNTTISKLKKQNDNTLTVFQEDTSCIGKCSDAIILAENYKTQSDSIQKELSIQMSIDSVYKNSLILAEADKTFLLTQNDSLRKVIITVPVYKPEKILGILPMPDKKTSFIAGAIVGIISTIEISRHIK